MQHLYDVTTGGYLYSATPNMLVPHNAAVFDVPDGAFPSDYHVVGGELVLIVA